jgi:acetoin utilization deacetylase AcuC-like enzyme
MLTVLVNEQIDIHNRVGFGSTNKPELRQKMILDAIEKNIRCDIIYSSDPISIDWLKNIHDSDYLYFLQNVYADWKITKDPHWVDESKGVIPNHFVRYKPDKSTPVYKLAGYYGCDFMTPIYEDTFKNALTSAHIALKATEISNNDKSNIVYALVNTPGHHAKSDQYGGYCFLNNGIISAYRFVELGKKKVGILDLDYHASSFEIIKKNCWFQNKIFATSIHISPKLDYPSFEGLESDNDSNIKHYPLNSQTEWKEYEVALISACEFLKKCEIEALVILFGADTYKMDPDPSPLGKFNLEIKDYRSMSCLVKKYFEDISIVITQEGGYFLEEVPNIVCAFLDSLL